MTARAARRELACLAARPRGASRIYLRIGGINAKIFRPWDLPTRACLTAASRASCSDYTDERNGRHGSYHRRPAAGGAAVRAWLRGAPALVDRRHRPDRLGTGLRATRSSALRT